MRLSLVRLAAIRNLVGRGRQYALDDRAGGFGVRHPPCSDGGRGRQYALDDRAGGFSVRDSEAVVESLSTQIIL